MPRVALSTCANRSVLVGLADCVALLTAGRGCRMTFRKHERIRRAFRPSWLELFAEGDLLRTQALLAAHGGPTGGGVAAAKKFLIDAFVAGTAIPSCQMGADGKAVVIHLLLARPRLVAVEAIYTLLRVGGHLVFMDN